jgi:single-strand DNA-binding protein
MFINQATVFGNLTRDPELKTLPSGQSVCSFSVATNKKWKDKDGNMQESVEYHNIVAWGKTAENVARYMTKGSSIYVQGELQTRSWEKDGHKNYRTEINAFTVQFGPKREGSGNTGGGQQSAPASQDTGMPEYPEEEINPDDIPF